MIYYFEDRLTGLTKNAKEISLIKLSDKKPSRNPLINELYILYDKNREHLKYWHHHNTIAINSVLDLRKRYRLTTAYLIYIDDKMIGSIEIDGPKVEPQYHEDEEGNDIWHLAIVCELSYWIDKDYIRQGITEASIEMIESMLFPLGVDIIEINIEMENKPSLALAKKLDYHLTASVSTLDFDFLWQTFQKTMEDAPKQILLTPDGK